MKLSIRSEGEFVLAAIVFDDAGPPVMVGCIAKQFLEEDEQAWQDWRKMLEGIVSRKIHQIVGETPVTRKVAIAVWRDPWMVVGRDTFTGDLVRRLGWENVYTDAGDSWEGGSGGGATDLRRVGTTLGDRVLVAGGGGGQGWGGQAGHGGGTEGETCNGMGGGCIGGAPYMAGGCIGAGVCTAGA